LQTTSEILDSWKKPDERRRETWGIVLDREVMPLELQARAEAFKPGELEQIMAQYKGGICEKCRRSFRRVNVDTPMTLGFYFSPHEDCRCYVRCPRCKHPFVAETIMRIVPDVCTECGWRLRLVMKGAERMRYGAEYERHYNGQLQRNNAALVGGVYKRIHPMHWLHDTWNEKWWEEGEAKRKGKKKEFDE